MSGSNGEKVEWTEEEFYFGNACTPSWVTYRSSGERLQVRAERQLQLRSTDDLQNYVADLAPEFLTRFTDHQLLVMKGGQSLDGSVPIPSLYLIGWQEITDPDDRERYERDKKDAWRKPEHT